MVELALLFLVALAVVVLGISSWFSYFMAGISKKRTVSINFGALPVDGKQFDVKAKQNTIEFLA